MTKFLYRNAARRKFVIKFISEKATEIQGTIVEYLTEACKTLLARHQAHTNASTLALGLS